MIKAFSCGLIDSNTYIAWEESSKEGMIIDCGVNPTIIHQFILENGISVKYIVLTHGHVDHAEYVEEYSSFFPLAKVVCHADELVVLNDIEANLSTWGQNPRAYKCNYTTVTEGDVLSLEKSGETCMNFTVLHTPGHTPGGICLYCEKDKIMFTGDTLFLHSYGRTDFKYGDTPTLYASLRRLLSIDTEIVFYPGHYQSSTIGAERNYYDMD